jgi:putative endonuclease
MGALSRIFKPISVAAAAFFRHDLALRRGRQGVEIVLEPRLPDGIKPSRKNAVVDEARRKARGELDLLLEKPDRLLLVEVKGRRSGVDGWGVAALQRGKRRRLERAWRCWLAEHPHEAQRAVELVYALVPLPPRRGPIRWIRVGF